MSSRFGSRAWLIPLARAVFDADAADADPGPPFPGAAAYERWLVAQLDERGIAVGLPRDLLGRLGESTDAIDYSRFAMINSAAHRLGLALRLFRRQRLALELPACVALVFAALGHAQQAPDLAEAAFRFFEDPPAGGAGLDALNAIAVKLADRLSARALSAGHPLLGHPFHQILLYNQALCFGRIAWAIVEGLEQPGGRPDPSAILRALGLAQAARHQAIEASIALAWADGVIDPPERQLIDALVAGAGLSDTERAMVRAEFERPRSPESLAGEITEVVQRAFILRLTLLTAHANGELAEPEQDFLLRLAAAFGIASDDLDRFTAEALASYEQHARLLRGRSIGGMVNRLRASLVERIEDVVKRNATRLHAEIRETSELGQLLVKACGTELTPAERKAVRDQLLDICRTIPALAIFAAPGGAVLLPIAVKHLPFKILPGNFDDRETLEGPVSPDARASGR